MERNIAVVLAGGTGQRAGLDEPKQFYELGGRLVLEWAVEAFERHPAIDDLLIVSHADHADRVRELVRRNAWKKVRRVVLGGAERYHSSLNAIRACDGEARLLFHDAARPLVSAAVIDRVVAALETYDAVGTALPATDTILEVENGRLRGVPDRSRLWQAQTPQAFRRSVIADAYDRALQDDNFRATDDCGVLLRYRPDVPIGIVEGAPCAMKLTYRSDIPFLEKFLP